MEGQAKVGPNTRERRLQEAIDRLPTAPAWEALDVVPPDDRAGRRARETPVRSEERVAEVLGDNFATVVALRVLQLPSPSDSLAPSRPRNERHAARLAEGCRLETEAESPDFPALIRAPATDCH